MIAYDFCQEMWRIYNDIWFLIHLRNADPEFVAEHEKEKQQFQESFQKIKEKVDRNGYQGDVFYYKKDYKTRHIS